MRSRQGLENLSRHAVLKHFHDTTRDSISHAAEATGLSYPTVATVVRALERDGLLARKGFGPGSGGRHPQLYEFRSDAASIIGIEVHDHRLRAVLFDLKVARMLEREVPLGEPFDPEHLSSAASRLLTQVLEVGPRAPLGVGLVVGAPDADEPATAAFARCAQEVRGRLGHERDLNVICEAQTIAWALAEGECGAAQDVEDFILVDLDAPPRCAIVRDGAPQRDRQGEAGRLPRTASLGVLLDRALEKSEHPHPGFARLLQRARRPQHTEAKAIEKLCGLVAGELERLTLLLHPEVIVLAGELSAADDAFLAAVSSALGKRLRSRQAPALRCAALGDNGPITGAALRVEETCLLGVSA